VILPALLEQSHTRTWLKALVRAWCRVVAWMLDLQSYLLRDQADDPGPAVIEEPQHPDLGAAHQALLQREGPTGFQPYVRPRWFPARLVGLLFCVCISLVIASLVAMTLPVWLGRRVMALWMVGAPAPSPPVLPPTLTGSGKSKLFVFLFIKKCNFKKKYYGLQNIHFRTYFDEFLYICEFTYIHIHILFCKLCTDFIF